MLKSIPRRLIPAAQTDHWLYCRIFPTSYLEFAFWGNWSVWYPLTLALLLKTLDTGAQVSYATVTAIPLPDCPLGCSMLNAMRTGSGSRSRDFLLEPSFILPIGIPAHLEPLRKPQRN
jgi:hypothetical protein